MRRAADKFKRKPDPSSYNSKNAQRATRRGFVEPPPGFSQESEVANFSVNPELEPVVKSMPRRAPPSPMYIGQRAYFLGIHSDDYPTFEAFQAHMEEATAHFVLTARESIIEDKAYLTFSSALAVSPKQGALLRPEDSGKVWLHLFVEGGRSYLIDFVVRSSRAGSYRVNAKTGEHVYEDLAGSYNHVTARLTADGSGWTYVSLTQDQGIGFELYAVAVTSVDQALLSMKSSEKP